MATKKSMAQMTRKLNIHGDSETEKLAALILPILVRQAKAKKTITYLALGKEVNANPHTQIPRALGIIGHTLSDPLYFQEMGDNPPPINVCVVNQKTGEPSKGVDLFVKMWRPNYYNMDHSEAMKYALKECFSYPNWDKVLEKLKLEPRTAFGDLIEASAHNYSGGGGEGPEHKDFKDYVRKHPEKLHLSKNMISSSEFELKSGDRLDVVFENDKMIVGVEVKSKISQPEDIQRGLFQAVKYQAVLTAMEDVAPKKKEVKVFLVLEKTLPAELIWERNTLGVEVIESFREASL